MSEAEETPIAWIAIIAGCPVVAANGDHLGHVTEVAGLPEDDIFHGVVFQNTVLGKHMLAPAADVARITDHAVYLSTEGSAAENYPEFKEMEVEHLGIRGLFFWKHLGWKKSSK